MAARTKARKRALDVLFEAEQRSADLLTVLDERLILSGRQTPLPDYAVEMVRGVAAHQDEIDARLTSASPEWSLNRMPAVDRSVLRLALWEIMFSDAVPAPVAIDEAMDLAGDLSTEDSARFVGGVLGALATREDGSASTHHE